MKPIFTAGTPTQILLITMLTGSYLHAEETINNETIIDTTSSIGTSVNTESKLTNEFAEFLGSEEQAAIVVDGLRQGKSFSYTTGESEVFEKETPIEANNTPTPENPIEVDPNIIEPPTDSMGYGNVKLTLKLAESKLAEMGITQPTNEQLSAVLPGGNIDGQPVDGVLVMRADGMGWGEIAHQYNMKVGQLMGKAKPAATPETTTQLSPANSKGYIAPYSKKSTAGFSKHHSNGYIPSSKNHAAAKGMVTANGMSAHQPGYIKNNGKIKPIKTANIHHGNKHSYIPSSSAASSTTVTSAGAATHSSMGKAKGHIHKK